VTRLRSIVSSTARVGPQDTQGLSSAAYDKIKQAIIECVLPPGEEISQSQLEHFVGLGKAPVRTALTRLHQEGLVSSVPRRGYVVSAVTMRDIENLFGLRLILEPEATGRAAERLTAGDLSRLAELAQIGFTAGDLDSERDFLRANRAFHLTIAQASGNARLAKVMEQLLDEGMRIIFLTMSISDLSDTWRHGHEEIYSALVERDPRRAADIARSEIEDGLKDVAKAVMSSPAVSQMNIRPIASIGG
jgi:DNA-binding GntR family transcriptional regulator